MFDCYLAFRGDASIREESQTSQHNHSPIISGFTCIPRTLRSGRFRDENGYAGGEGGDVERLGRREESMGSREMSRGGVWER